MRIALGRRSLLVPEQLPDEPPRKATCCTDVSHQNGEGSYRRASLRTERTDWYGATSWLFLSSPVNFWGRELAPKARSNLVAFYATAIKEHRHKVLDGIFAVCDLLVQAKDEKLDQADWELLKDDLPFSDSVIKKLLVIGRDARLRKASVYKLLPSSYSIIYEITQLDDKELTAALRDEQISPRMHRGSFLAWRNNKRGNSDESEALNPLSVGFIGMLRLGEVAVEATTSGATTLKLKQELDELAKRYKGRVEYAERGALQRARDETLGKLGAKLQRLLEPYNKQVSQQELAIIENALWQHKFHEAGKSLPYPHTHPRSIENTEHPYSIHNSWDYKSMLEEMDRRHIITTRTPIKDKKGLEDARCLQLAIRYLDTTHGSERDRLKRALKRIAGATSSKHGKLARWCLEQITPFERVGLR